MESEQLSCNVCDKPALGVCCSVMGPISHAYCRECLELGRQPWNTLVDGLIGCSRDDVMDAVQPIIEATCKFYGRGEDELWREVAESTQDFITAMENAPQPEDFGDADPIFGGGSDSEERTFH